jgi:hypothetical protein
MKRSLLTLAVALAFGFAGGAGAAMNKDEYKAQKSRIEANYSAAKERCDPLKDNAQDICKAEAKGQYEVAKAELEAQNNPSPRTAAKVKTERAQAQYNVAKERCDDLDGNRKDVCVKDAKAAYESAKADAKATRTVDERGPNSTRAAGAAREARDDRMDAQYAAAKERCDAMSGQAKDNCLNDAKKKFGKM